MAAIDSALDADALARARRLLKKPVRAERLWPVLAAAGFAAASALTLAAAMIMAPPPGAQPLVRDSSGQLIEVR